MRGRARWEEPLFKEAAISYVQSLLPGPEKKAVRTIADVKLTHSDAAFICLMVTNQLMKASGQEEEQADGAADGEDEGDEEGCGLETTDAVAKSTQVHNTNRKAWARLLVLAEEYGGERGKGAAGSFALLDDDEAAAKCVACVTPGAHTKDVAKKVRKALGFKQRV